MAAHACARGVAVDAAVLPGRLVAPAAPSLVSPTTCPFRRARNVEFSSPPVEGIRRGYDSTRVWCRKESATRAGALGRGLRAPASGARAGSRPHRDDPRAHERAHDGANVSRERIRQIEPEALQAMRKRVRATEPPSLVNGPGRERDAGLAPCMPCGGRPKRRNSLSA